MKISGCGALSGEKAAGAPAPLGHSSCPSCLCWAKGSQHPARTSVSLLLPFVCRPGLAVPGPQRELPGELPAAVPGEPGSPAQVLRQVSVRSAVSRRCRAPEPRPKVSCHTQTPHRGTPRPSLAVRAEDTSVMARGPAELARDGSGQVCWFRPGSCEPFGA